MQTHCTENMRALGDIAVAVETAHTYTLFGGASLLFNGMGLVNDMNVLGGALSPSFSDVMP